MDHYCSKCLINKVANEGDICASCGGNAAKQLDPAASRKVSINVQTPAAAPSRISTRRRIISAGSKGGNSASAGQTAAPSATPSANSTAYSSPNAAPQPSSASAQKAAKKNANAPLEGVIQNFDTGTDDRSFFTRVSDSLFKGISYNGRNNLVMTEFQLYENWNSGYSSSAVSKPVATRVICYGKIGQGRPVENNDVRVYGIRDKANNYFIAEQIENTTDGTFANFVPSKLSAAFVRLIVLALVLAAAGLFSFLSFSKPALAAPVNTRQIFIGVSVILVGAITFLIGKCSLIPGRRFLLISFASLLIALGIFIITLRDAGAKVSQFGDSLLNVVVYLFIFRIAFSLMGVGRWNYRVRWGVTVCFICLGIFIAIYLALSIFLT